MHPANILILLLSIGMVFSGVIAYILHHINENERELDPSLPVTSNGWVGGVVGFCLLIIVALIV